MSTNVWVTIFGRYYLNDTPLSVGNSQLVNPSAALIAALVPATPTEIATAQEATEQQVNMLGNNPNSYCSNTRYS